MLNKKGITLIEIIVSIGLISIVMIYLFNLLVDMQYEEDHASYAKENAVNRATIIRIVQDDFMEYGLQAVNQYTDDSISFTFDDGSMRTMNITANSISYNGETWLLDTDNDEEVYDVDHIEISTTPSNTCSYIMNVDTDGDGNCNYNCDMNGNNILDSDEMSTQSDSYRACSDYTYFHVTIPVVTGSSDNVIDDLEFFYIGRKG